MAAIFSAQSTTSNLPIIIIAGDGIFIEYLLEALLIRAKVIHIARNAYAPGNYAERYTHVKQVDADMVSRLQEKVEYAVLYLQQEQDKKVFHDILPKIKNDGVKTSVVLSVRSLPNLYDIIVSGKLNEQMTFLLLGDLISPTLPSSYIVSERIRQALASKTFVLAGDDLNPVFPISLSDAVESTLYSLFGDLKKSQFFLIFYNVPQTIISLVHLLKRVEPDLEIRYNQPPKNQSFFKSYDELLREIYTKTLLKPQHFSVALKGFEQSMQEFLDARIELPPTKKEHVVPTHFFKSKLHFFQNRNGINVLFISLLLYIFLNIVFTITGLYFGKKTLVSFSHNDLKMASVSAHRANLFLGLAGPTIGFTTQVLSAVTNNPSISTNYDALQKGLSLTDTAFSIVLPTLQHLPQGISSESLDNTLADITNMYFSVEQLSLENIPQMQSIVHSPYMQYASLLSTVPDVLGYHGVRTYLILFQNNGELRPNGGFVGSIGQLSLDQGKVTEFHIQDVYQPDGQLKQHVEPDYIIRRYIQPHLYLRDSTFSLDFQDSASQAAQIYYLETGTKVDGVIAVDYEVLRRIIEQVGPISLPSYHVTLDANNTFDFLQKTIDTDFFPGSTQKKDVLSALFNQLLLKLSQPDKQINVAKIIPNLLQEKHILFAFQNPSIQQAYNLDDLGGTLRDTRPANANTLNDFLSINEANIGVNKVNEHLTRVVNYHAKLSGNTINSQINIVYTNNDIQEYKDYLRVIVPHGSTLQSIVISGVKQAIVPAITDFRVYEAKGFTPPQGLEVDQSDSHNLTAFGFITTVPAGGNQSVTIAYTNGANVPQQTIIDYSLLYLKQPGTLVYPFSATLQYPSGYAPVNIPTNQVNQNSITWEGEVDSDMQYLVRLQQ